MREKVNEIQVGQGPMTPTPELQRQYDQAVAAIVKAVPDQVEEFEGGYLFGGCRSPKLEDVLQAVQQEGKRRGIGFGLKLSQAEKVTVRLMSMTPDLSESGADWHLGHDLAWHRDNAPETIRFLHGLFQARDL